MRTLLLVGKSGQLGGALAKALQPLGHVLAPDRSQLDFADISSVRKCVRSLRPAMIVNAAAYTAVDEAESDDANARLINAGGPAVLAEEAKQAGALLVHFSTDYVYDGTLNREYTEDDEPYPVNVYGTTKLEGDQAIIASGCRYVILRTSWLYSATRSNFVLTILKLAREQDFVRVVDDEVGSPTWAVPLAESTARLLDTAGRSDHAHGIYHISAEGHASRRELALRIVESGRRISRSAGPWASIEGISSSDYPSPAKRPLNVPMSKAKLRRDYGIVMASWQEQLDAFLAALFEQRPL